MTRRFRIPSPPEEVIQAVCQRGNWCLVEEVRTPRENEFFCTLCYEQPFYRVEFTRVALAIVVSGNAQSSDIAVIGFAGGGLFGIDWGAARKLVSEVETILNSAFQDVTILTG